MKKKKLNLLMILILTVNTSLFSQWELIWSDEFEYTGLPDKSKWDYDVGTGSNGWGNNELQYYTKDSLKNARVENGTLIITARKEKIAQSNYTSARLVTRKKGDWCYGKFEIAAKLPKGRGVWPAIWMLPTDGEYGIWPKSGEIDIMENVGFEPNNIYFTVHTEAYNHTKGTQKGSKIFLEDPHNTFNIYSLEWYEDSLVFFVNNKKTFVFKNEHKDYTTWPFDKRFYLILNIAVGGSWGGQQGVDDSIFPQEMVVDYVKVYRYSETAVKLYSPYLERQKEKLYLTSLSYKIFSLDGKILSSVNTISPLSSSVSADGYYIIKSNNSKLHSFVFVNVKN